MSRTHEKPKRIRPPSRWSRARLAALALLLTTLAIGLWAYQRLHESVLQLRGDDLRALLDAQVNTLDLWVGELQVDAARLAARRDVEDEIGAILVTPRRLRGSGRLFTILQENGNPGRVVALHVIDRRGIIVASRFENYIGREVTVAIRERLAPVFADRPVFIRPYHENERVMRLDAPFEHRLLWVETPVHDRGDHVIAALGFGYRADGQFAQIFKAIWPGRSGEVFAFDKSARLLTESRHAAETRREASPGAAPTLGSVQLRQPLRSGSEADAAETPLTALAQAAIASSHAPASLPMRGLLLEPYRNVRGKEVIGAWRWLSEYDMGVGVEIEAAEAYAPLRYLNIGIAGVLVLMLLVGASLFVPRETLARWFPRGARRVGPYHLVRLVGEGAISEVYLARHKFLHRPAAVKILKPLASTDEWRARFEREVQLVSRLHHPNTIAVYDYGLTAGGSFYYAMEYVDGLSLAELVERNGPIPPARTAYLLRQICASLAQAHAQGIIHRDIKPQNIMVCRYGGAGDLVKVLDFGLVKQLNEDESRDLSKALRVLGTPLYMSPERIRNPKAADARVDVYSIGAVGFFLLTGRRLFETESDYDLTYHILHVPAPRASTCASQPIPPALDDLIARCLAKDPADRPASMLALMGSLDAILAEHPWTLDQIESSWGRSRGGHARAKD